MDPKDSVIMRLTCMFNNIVSQTLDFRATFFFKNYNALSLFKKNAKRFIPWLDCYNNSSLICINYFFLTGCNCEKSYSRMYWSCFRSLLVDIDSNAICCVKFCYRNGSNKYV